MQTLWTHSFLHQGYNNSRLEYSMKSFWFKPSDQPIANLISWLANLDHKVRMNHNYKDALFLPVNESCIELIECYRNFTEAFFNLISGNRCPWCSGMLSIYSSYACSTKHTSPLICHLTIAAIKIVLLLPLSDVNRRSVFRLQVVCGHTFLLTSWSLNHVLTLTNTH